MLIVATVGLWLSGRTQSDHERAITACADAQELPVRGRAEVSYGSNPDSPSDASGWRVWLAPRGGNTKRYLVTEQDGVMSVAFIRSDG